MDYDENLLNIDYDIIKNGNDSIMSLKNFEIIDDNFYKNFIEKKILLKVKLSK